MTIHFGLDFDGPVFREKTDEAAPFFGPKSLTRWLETALGLGSRPENTDYLRIELFRQSLQQHLRQNPLAFFAKSFEADRFATAQHLLDWRDELLTSGWDFGPIDALQIEGMTSSHPLNHPLQRLADIATVESFFHEKINDAQLNPQAFGWADRLAQIINAAPPSPPGGGEEQSRTPPHGEKSGFDWTLGVATPPLRGGLGGLEVIFHEPMDLLPAGWQRLFLKLKKNGTAVDFVENQSPEKAVAVIDFLQKKLKNPARPIDPPAKLTGSSDGIFILKTERESSAASFFAQFLQKNPTIQPVFLVPELSRSLDDACAREGLPGMGILSASLARPSLQILKLAPAFLWEPIDVAKMMEFVTLPIKPLDDGLSLLLARLLAEKPGLNNDKWMAATAGFFENSENPELKKQFDFWFNRRRYRSTDDVPKREVVAIYEYLNNWASTIYEETSGKYPSLLVLADQSRRIRELLDALPDQRLGFLEIERIVRTIYQPAPLNVGSAEVGHFPFVHQPGAIAGATDDLVWWNFSHNEPAHFPQRWTAEERSFFEKKGIKLATAEQQNRLNRLRQVQPILRTKRRLFFVFPQKIAGDDVQPNGLMGDLEAIFGKDFHQFQYDLDSPEDRARLAQNFALPGQVFLEKSWKNRPGAFVEIARPEALREPEYETPTSLESLFYYPYQWFLKGKTRLRPASILSISGENTLLGNLAHRFFEDLLREEFHEFDQKTVENWVNLAAKQLFEREGATMLLYGREPERAAFLSKIRRSAWSLISLIKENHWRVEATEKQLDGLFCGLSVRGKADLILARGEERAVVDLKWSGFNRRREMIKNREDLQLVFYSKLTEPVEIWAHTAYFILEDAKMVARNTAAFSRATAVEEGGDHAAAAQEIFEKMEKTFAWRMAQIRAGQLEVRTKEAAAALEAHYEGQPLFELLEMRGDSARYDDFRVLIG